MKAMVFPGQGSQQVGMLAEFYDAFDCFSAVFKTASDVLGYDLWHLIQSGPQEQLNLTENTQPSLLACSVALWRVWSELGGAEPDYMAGHSLGEWSALVCADVLSLEDALRLVQLRGRYMQEAVPVGEGAMAAIIGLDDQKIIDICQQQEGVVAAVNFNAPGQVVIAGVKAAVDTSCEVCKEAGAKRAMPLAVSAPFHSSLMQPAADRLADDLQNIAFSSPRVPVVHNVTAQTESSGDAIRNLIIEQIASPVRWTECVQTLAAAGVSNTFECGPGKVLGTMIKRIDKTLSCSALDSIDAMQAAIESTR